MKALVALLSAIVAVLAALVWTMPAFPQASSTVLVDNTTAGRYNAALGTALDGTQPQFPCDVLVCGDPTIDPAPEPDLTSVGSILGGWLSSSPSFNSNWSGPQAIPPTWVPDTETAIVYEIDGGKCGISDVTGSFGVDNGIFVWVNGAYKFGAVAPFFATPGEYVVTMGDLPPGKSFVQILREDSGVATGYDVQITGTAKACSGGGDEEDADEIGKDDDDHGHHDGDDSHHHGDDEDRN